MKSLSDNYNSAHGNSHETFTDLVFCTLVVLVLFVLALAIEVGHKHRYLTEGALAAEEIHAMSEEEIATLMQELGEKKVEIEETQSELKKTQSELAKKQALYDKKIKQLRGQHRYTGSRQPATMHLAYDYRFDRFYFLPATEVTLSLRSRADESTWDFGQRKRNELRRIAGKAKTHRSYTLAEIQDIFSAFSRYHVVKQAGESFNDETEQIAITYVFEICAAISGDEQLPSAAMTKIQERMRQVVSRPGPGLETMFPVCRATVIDEVESVGLRMSQTVVDPDEARSILLSLEGRPAVLELQGCEGHVPTWLVEKILQPTGHVLRTPWLPELNVQVRHLTAN